MLTFEKHASILDINPGEWNSLTNPEFPFYNHEFLAGLQRSGCVGGDTGWQPQYLLGRRGDRLTAATPVFLKDHSLGEFIFDWQWAEVAQHVGLPYYPKLVLAAPFTPATGPKILCSDKSEGEGSVYPEVLREIKVFSQVQKAHSVHALFISDAEIESFTKMGFHIRDSYQYHWFNRDYEGFDDFLDHLRAKKAKEIRRERQAVKNQAIQIEVLTGPELTTEHALEMYRFYHLTIDKKWSLDYLNVEFFAFVFETMKPLIVYFRALDRGRPVAGSLCWTRGSKLFGRYWGCLENYKNLHFEMCYYKPIEWAIGKKTRWFEAGAQGEHKIQRGFLPTRTLSAHWFHDEQFHGWIGKFVQHERALLATRIDQFKSPFRQ